MQTIEPTIEEWEIILARRMNVMNEARLNWSKRRQSVPYRGHAEAHESWYEYRVRHGLAVPEGMEN